jgi:hypothetical protein
MASSDFLKSLFLKIHKLGLKINLQIIPNHYYSSIADINKLSKTREFWAKKSEMPGVETNVSEQGVNLQKVCLPFQKEYAGNINYRFAVENTFGPGFGFIEAQALHGIIRYFKPQRIFEVGSGVSSYCALKALEYNKVETGKMGSITCVEPFPSDSLRKLGVKIVEEEVQKVPYNKFLELEKNDVLFIDSSHTVKTGSDVNYLILEVLPRLKSGVIVHFHDIYFPYDYQRNILSSFFQWSETSLLRAYLINNKKIKILFCLSMLHYDNKEVLKQVFPEYEPLEDKNGLIYGSNSGSGSISKHFPASIYLQIL